MADSSDLFGCPILETADDVAKSSKGYGRGLLPRDLKKHPIGFNGRYTGPLIPEHEWADRILARERDGAVVSQVAKAAGVLTKNQGQTNFCWANAPVLAVEILRVMAGHPYVELSPASVACKINGFKNEGGWGSQATEFIGSHGVVPARLWPSNGISRSYDTEAANVERAKYKLSEWDDLPARSFQYLMTMLLLGIPIPVGYNWWGHEVLAVDPILFKDRTFGIRFWNSWSDDFGRDGLAILRRDKAIPDDAIAPRVALAS